MTDQPSVAPADFSAASPAFVPAVSAAFDVASWFLDRARTDDAAFGLQKLQRLLYLAQGLYAVLAQPPGGLLMPAVFVADESGPVEGGLRERFRALAEDRDGWYDPQPSTS